MRSSRCLSSPKLNHGNFVKQISVSSAALWITYLLLLAGSCGSPRSEFQPTAASARSATSSGRLQEALAVYESQAQTAEKEAKASLFSRPYWELATINYSYASQAARDTGDMQKAIIYGERALQSAEKIDEPLHQLTAVHRLMSAYSAVGIFDKTDALLPKGRALVQRLPPTTRNRENWEGILADETGRAFLRQKKYPQATEAFFDAIHWFRTWMSGLSTDKSIVTTARSNILLVLGRLGSTHRQTGQLEQAMEYYREAFESIKKWNLTYPHENDLYAGMGEVYIQQKKYSEALENYKKALALVEAQRRPQLISSVNGRIAFILQQMGKPKEAAPYLKRAAEQKKSIRSLMVEPEEP